MLFCGLECNSSLFRGKIYKLHLRVDRLFDGCSPPWLDDIVCQELVMSRSGAFFYTAYALGRQEGGYKKVDEPTIHLAEAECVEILTPLERYFSTQLPGPLIQKSGKWELWLSNIEAEPFAFCGSLVPNLADELEISFGLMRKYSHRKDLFAFNHIGATFT